MATYNEPTRLTREAQLSETYDDGKRAVVFPDGLLVWVYVDPETATVRVSVDLDGVDPASTLQLKVDVAGQVVFDDSDEARADGTTVGC